MLSHTVPHKIIVIIVRRLNFDWLWVCKVSVWLFISQCYLTLSFMPKSVHLIYRVSCNFQFNFMVSLKCHQFFREKTIYWSFKLLNTEIKNKFAHIMLTWIPILYCLFNYETPCLLTSLQTQYYFLINLSLKIICVWCS